MSDISFDAIASAGGTVSLMHRLEADAGDPIRPTDVAAIAYTIYDVGPSGTLEPIPGHDAQALDPAAVMLDELATGKPWTADTIGYNFRHTLSVGEQPPFPAWGKRYLLVYHVTLESGASIVWRWIVRTPAA